MVHYRNPSIDDLSFSSSHCTKSCQQREQWPFPNPPTAGGCGRCDCCSSNRRKKRMGLDFLSFLSHDVTPTRYRIDWRASAGERTGSGAMVTQVCRFVISHLLFNLTLPFLLVLLFFMFRSERLEPMMNVLCRFFDLPLLDSRCWFHSRRFTKKWTGRVNKRKKTRSNTLIFFRQDRIGQDKSPLSQRIVQMGEPGGTVVPPLSTIGPAIRCMSTQPANRLPHAKKKRNRDRTFTSFTSDQLSRYWLASMPHFSAFLFVIRSLFVVLYFASANGSNDLCCICLWRA